MLIRARVLQSYKSKRLTRFVDDVPQLHALALFRGKAVINKELTYRDAVHAGRLDYGVHAAGTLTHRAGQYQFWRDQFIVAPGTDASPQFLPGLGAALRFALIQLAHFAFVFVKVLTAAWHFPFSTLLGGAL